MSRPPSEPTSVTEAADQHGAKMVSVVICSRNRCELLRRTLAGFCSLVVPADLTWELLVVDNASTDATDQVVADHLGRLPLRRVYEPTVGLSKARNTAVRAAAGDLVLFTDDDVKVDPAWMTAYVAAARDAPHAAYFAGLIHPQFGAGVPAWVSRNQKALAGMLSWRDLGPHARELRRGEFPYGPNMALRRVLLRSDLFDERVGRAGDDQVRGSESSLFLYLERQGLRGVWVPGAMVHHYIPPSRANVGYLWRHYSGSGRTHVRLAVVCDALPLWRIPLAALKEMAKSCRWWWVWARHVATVAVLCGQLSELKRLLARRVPDDTKAPRHPLERS